MAENKKSQRKRAKIKIGPIPLILQTSEPADDRIDVASVLLFEIGGKPFAIGVENTEGVVDCPRISPLPSPPDGMAGVASVRGRTTLVMDLSLTRRRRQVKRATGPRVLISPAIIAAYLL